MRGKAVLATASNSDEHGLDPRRYAKLTEAAHTASAETREAAVTLLAALYARDARGGRINPAQVSRLITATPTLPDTAAMLNELANAANPAATLDAWNPRHAGYLALKARLAALRGSDLTSSLSPAPVGASRGSNAASTTRVSMTAPATSWPSAPRACWSVATSGRP